jgi:hypothetical protein
MTDDLVKRLREKYDSDYDEYDELCQEAADRIEEQDRLIAITGKINIQLVEHTTKQIGRIWELEEALREIAKHDLQAIAMDALRPGERAALGEKKDG